MTPGRLDVAVLGPGGVGGFLAGALARSGDSVLVLAGEATARGLNEKGLTVESRKLGNFHVSVRAMTRLDEPVDACFITVKATQLEEALERLPAERVGRALVVPFLNGIDHVAFLRAGYGSSRVAAGTIRIEAAKVGTGLIRQTSPFVGLEIAARPDNREQVETVAAHLRSAGLDVTIRDDEAAMLWDKLALLAPMALLTTHERATAGVIRSQRRDEVIAVIGEIAAVAAADGVEIDPSAVLRLMDSVPPTMESSMQRDQAAGRPLELDAIGGVILRRAAAARIAVPATARLVDDLATRSGVRVRMTPGE